MKNKIEDQRNEFKIKLTEDLEKTVISFLNADGGNLYIGVNDKGIIEGVKGNIDLLQRTIKDRIKDNIRPSIMGLFDVVLLEQENKKYIKIIVAKGYEKPYYIKGMGMSPDSCFIRVGSSIESMSEENILNLFSKRVRNSLKNIKSPIKELDFKTLKIY